MFTGLVETLGRVARADLHDGGLRLALETGALAGAPERGESLAVNGCCLTVVDARAGACVLDVVPESLSRTTLGALRPGDPVNLERALTLAQRLGGHLVQGHVDGVAEILEVLPEGEGRRLVLALPPELERFVAAKGSIAIDGTSLTVAAVRAHGCEIALIPHTLRVTISGHYRAGARVNLEVDLLARYLARLLESASPSGRTP